MSKKKVELKEAKDFAEMLNKALGTKTFHSDPNKMLSNIRRWLSTGVTVADGMTTGGIPVGRVTELYGPPDVGKSTFAQWVAKTSLLNDCLVFYIDKENALDRIRAKNIGLDLSKVVHMYPSTVEQTFEYISKSLQNIIKHGIEKPSIFIWDTLARTKTKEQSEGKNKLGSMARAVRASIISELDDILPTCNAALLILNHRVAKNIGTGRSSYGSVGGSALYHEASLRIKMLYSAEKRLEENDQVVGHVARLELEESNVCAPHRDCHIHVRYKEGIDDFGSSVLFMQKVHGFTLNGTWWSWVEGKKEYKFQNASTLKDKLIADKKMEAFNESVKEKYKELYG